MSAASWFTPLQSEPESRVCLICFPFAGGGLPVFRRWPEQLSPEIELWAVQLPGRGLRLSEPPFSRLDMLVAELAAELPSAMQRPFALFGHSMGARVAFELARALRRSGATMPLFLFLSACPAPQLPPDGPDLHALPRAELLAELQAWGGTPPAVAQNSELLDLVMPALRADLAVVETAVYRPAPGAQYPRHGIWRYGRSHCAARTSLDAWHVQTNGRFRVQLFAGGHFFLETAVVNLTKIIKQDLLSVLP